MEHEKQMPSQTPLDEILAEQKDSIKYAVKLHTDQKYALAADAYQLVAAKICDYLQKNSPLPDNAELHNAFQMMTYAAFTAGEENPYDNTFYFISKGYGVLSHKFFPAASKETRKIRRIALDKLKNPQ